jgi:hypothetical protein
MNCAHIYNEACRSPILDPLLPKWLYTYELRGEMVTRSFNLHCLLLDCAARNTHLNLPHNLPRDERPLAALAARNRRLSGTGQEHWSHACRRCSTTETTPDGSLRMFMPK